jgi:hypothetical protein
VGVELISEGLEPEWEVVWIGGGGHRGFSAIRASG